MNVVSKESAIKKLKNGLPIIFQTDTLPAIGCLPNFSKIIYEIKKRDSKKPLILMGAEISQLTDYVDESARKDYENIASKFWPGPLTLIIPISKNKKSVATSENFTLGLRIPNSSAAQSLIKETGPLLTSSANISGIQGSITPEGIANDLPSVDILGPVPWEQCSGCASTIISWVKYGGWRLIRNGQVSIKDLL
tara:strand:- start:62 stop:643 length:582 start_codon:yes stop_codon:yes gene_type:complete